MADSNKESTPKEQEKESETAMDSTNSDEEVKDEKETSDTEDVKDNKEENDEAEDEEEDESEEEQEEEELPPGLLEQPLEVQGKREKKKVERLSAAMVQSTEKKKVEIEEGSGVKLGDIAYIEHKLNGIKAIELKPLHRLLFNRIGAVTEVKRNIRQFCGFTHSKESKEHEKRMAQLNKMHMPELKSLCLVLALERSGAKKDVVDRIMDFLMNPDDKGMKVPQSKRSKSKSKSPGGKKEKNKGTKRKRTPKESKKNKAENDGDDDDLGSQEDDDDDDDETKDISEQEIEEESEEEAPKKKKAKVEPKKKTSPKVNGKKEKSPKKKEQKKRTPKKKPEILNDSLSEDSDSDDEPLVNKKKAPPSNDEIKDLVKKILDGADLESVTMKTVVKEVYSRYPTFDLSDRKDFIKTTVREVIS